VVLTAGRLARLIQRRRQPERRQAERRDVLRQEIEVETLVSLGADQPHRDRPGHPVMQTLTDHAEG